MANGYLDCVHDLSGDFMKTIVLHCMAAWWQQFDEFNLQLELLAYVAMSRKFC
jgi:hypothetical protein